MPKCSLDIVSATTRQCWFLDLEIAGACPLTGVLVVLVSTTVGAVPWQLKLPFWSTVFWQRSFPPVLSLR